MKTGIWLKRVKKAARPLTVFAALLLLAASVAAAAPAPEVIGEPQPEKVAAASAMAKKLSTEVAGDLKRPVELTEEGIRQELVKAANKNDRARVEELAKDYQALLNQKSMTKVDGGFLQNENVFNKVAVFGGQSAKSSGISTNGISASDGNLCIVLLTGRVSTFSPKKITFNVMAGCQEPDTMVFHLNANSFDVETWQHMTEWRDGATLVTRAYTLANFVPQHIYDDTWATAQPYAYWMEVNVWFDSPDMDPDILTYEYPFNKPGVPYPAYYDRNSDRDLWFPDSPYNPPMPGDSKVFGRECRALYDQNGWNWITIGENHHMKPSRWGGENIGGNCMRLPLSVHYRFNDWWGSGNRYFETHVSH